MNNFGRRLSNVLKENGMSQKDFAKSIGATEVSVSRYINGQSFPNALMLKKISHTLNCSTDYLLGLSNHPQETVLDFDLMLVQKARATMTVEERSRMIQILRLIFPQHFV